MGSQAFLEASGSWTVHQAGEPKHGYKGVGQCSSITWKCSSFPTDDKGPDKWQKICPIGRPKATPGSPIFESSANGVTIVLLRYNDLWVLYHKGILPYEDVFDSKLHHMTGSTLRRGVSDYFLLATAKVDEAYPNFPPLDAPWYCPHMKELRLSLKRVEPPQRTES